MRAGKDLGTKRKRGFTLLETLFTLAVVSILGALLVSGARHAIVASSLATSAGNLRQLAAGGAAYLTENRSTFWPYRQRVIEEDRQGIAWWFGYEDRDSLMRPEGVRSFDARGGPLAGFIPGGIQPDPSFSHVGKPFKPKYRFGYIGVGYNVLLGGGWMGTGDPARFHDLDHPGGVVVFATSAQVNTFQPPASARNPMVEEFYGIDDRNITVHFRHRGRAMVTFADASLGFLPMDESTRDQRAPDANVGRFAPVGSDRYLR